MANLKFSDFTPYATTPVTATSGLVAYEGTTNIQFTPTELAPFTGIYAADGTIGTTRKALITDTVEFKNAGDTLGVFTLNTNGSIGLGYNATQITTDSTSGGNVWLRNVTGDPLFSASIVSGSTGKINVYGGYYRRFEYAASKGLVFTNEAGFHVSQDNSSMLTCVSVTKGFLPPRMTTTQRDAINSGTFTTGLTLYNTTDNKLQFYNGTAWKNTDDNIYESNGTIGAGRVATITDFPKFSGTQANPIGLELENTQTGSGAMTTLGAQLKLTSNIATGTIGYFNSGSGGSNAPAMVLDSPGRILYKAAVDAGHIFQLAHGSFNFLNDASQNYPIFESVVAGGGSNYSEFRLAKTGTNYNYINSPASMPDKMFALGRTISGVDTEAIRINQANQLGINSDGLTISETLHVNGNARIDGQAYTEQHGAPLAGATIDWNNSNVQYIQLASGANTLSLNNPKSGATYILQVKQPSSGAAGTITYPTSVKYPGGTKAVLTTDNDAIDIITLIYNGTTTHYYASATLDLK